MFLKAFEEKNIFFDACLALIACRRGLEMATLNPDNF